MILKRLKRPQTNRPYSVPASLVQRFGGFLLDLGLLIGFLIALNIAYHVIFDIPFGRPRYVPPHADDGWVRVIRSGAISASLFALMAAFLASPMRASPGMTGFFIKAASLNGEKLSFFRGFMWTFTSFLPLIVANQLVLVGVALQEPVMHLGRLNLFSLMVILQSMWFAPVLIRKDKKSLPDIIWGVKVEYESVRPEGLHPLRRILHMPFLISFLLVMIVTSAVSAINLIDAQLNPKVALYEALKSPKINALRSTWRNEASFDISVKLTDFRCASKIERFRANPYCQDHEQVKALVEEHQELIRAYNQSLDVLQNDKTRLHDIYLNSESVALTDLVLADLIVQYESSKSPEVFNRLILLQTFWRNAAVKPGFLIGQSRALIHYSHTLLALPVFLATSPDLVEKNALAIDSALEPIIFDEAFLDGLMAYEYGLYNQQLRFSLLDFFPFIQPNHTRNEFVKAAEAMNQFFDIDLLTGEQELKRIDQINMQDKYEWYILYNPLGTRYRDYALKGLHSNSHTIAAYHSNNALKSMLKIYVDALRSGVPINALDDYLKTLPDDQRFVFSKIPLIWDPQTLSLYYSLPGLGGLRRSVQL